MSQLKFESLHNHTSDSDGSQSHLEILKSASAFNTGVIAFTEHDSLPSAKTLKQLKAYRGPVKWLVGIELTSKLPKASDRRGSFHVLGLFTDPSNQALLAHCRAIAQGRIERMQHFVKQLNSIGLKVTEADCMEEAAGGPVGSPHIVKALERYPENLGVIEEMRNKMKQAAANDADLASKYEIMLKEDPKLHVYHLFMKHSSFMPMPPAGDESLLSLEDSVGLIRDSGGIAVMAHWFFNKSVFPKLELEAALNSGNFDGIETDVANAISYKGHLTADISYLRGLVKQYDLIETVGSDSHSEADIEFFAKSKLAERSVGMTAGIIKRLKPSLEWSNLA